MPCYDSLQNYGGEMKGWKFAGGVLLALAITIQVALLGATTAWTKDYDPAVMAYWVQAIGSIAAILGALWIASEQHRRDLEAKQKADREFEYVLNAEIAWLSQDVLGFVNQFFDLNSNQNLANVISDDEVADLLERLSWCRQRAKHKGQLAMVGKMRKSVVGTARIIRLHVANPPVFFSNEDVQEVHALRVEAKKVMNAATGVEPHAEFMP